MKNIPTPSKGSSSTCITTTNTTKTTTPCCSKIGIKRGPWTPEEDQVLTNYINKEGEGRWRTLPKRAGLLRCGKSCRLRWMNYLRPSVKRGRIAPDEEDLILRLHRLLGNRWSLIAGRIPGRTDNEIKNYWNTHLSKKLISQGIDPRTHKPLKLNPNPTSSTHDQPNQSSKPNSFPSDQETGIRTHPHRAIATKVSENFTMAKLDKFQDQIVEDGALNWPSYDGFNMGLQGMHGQNDEDYIGTNGIEDNFSSFLDTLINESVFFNHQQHQPNMISAHQPMVSRTQTFNHGTIWEAEVMSSIAGLDGKDGFVHSNHSA